jgi:hypothetical protein
LEDALSRNGRKGRYVRNPVVALGGTDGGLKIGDSMQVLKKTTLLEKIGR